MTCGEALWLPDWTETDRSVTDKAVTDKPVTDRTVILAPPDEAFSP